MKTESYYNMPGYSTPMISHDSRSLEKLVEPLRDLQQNWNDGAGLLRMILEYPLSKKEYIYRKYHVPAIVDLVWFADQLSTSMDKENHGQQNLSVVVNRLCRYVFIDNQTRKKS